MHACEFFCALLESSTIFLVHVIFFFFVVVVGVVVAVSVVVAVTRSFVFGL